MDRRDRVQAPHHDWHFPLHVQHFHFCQGTLGGSHTLHTGRVRRSWIPGMMRWYTWFCVNNHWINIIIFFQWFYRKSIENAFLYQSNKSSFSCWCSVIEHRARTSASQFLASSIIARPYFSILSFATFVAVALYFIHEITSTEENLPEFNALFLFTLCKSRGMYERAHTPRLYSPLGRFIHHACKHRTMQIKKNLWFLNASTQGWKKGAETATEQRCLLYKVLWFADRCGWIPC